MPHVFHWRGAFDPNDVLNREGVQDALHTLLQNEATSKNIEKLKGHNVYSYRINKADRLLFTTVETAGVAYLVLLAYVDNHDYHKCKFLQPSVLKNFIENIDDLLEEVSDAHWSACERNVPFSFSNGQDEKKQPITPVEVEFFNQQFIALSDEQKKAIGAKLPAIISGPPGCGKSSTAFSIMSDWFTRHSDKTGEILYVTASADLATSMHAAWQDSPLALQRGGLKVSFKSYWALLKELSPPTLTAALASDNDFKTWFKSKQGILSLRNTNRPSSKGKRNKQSSVSSLRCDSEQLKSEFRILSGYQDNQFKAYYGKQSDGSALIGKKSSEIPLNQRKQVVTLYKAYQQWLAQKGKIDLALHPFTSNKRYLLVIIDEAQDFSTLQLKLLAALAENYQIYFCYDNNQSLHDPHSKQVHIEQIFPSSTLTRFSFQATYRSPASHIKLANRNLQLKQHVLTGVELKNDYHQICGQSENNQTGEIRWLECFDLKTDKPLINSADIAQIAVITPEVYIDEARALYDTNLVFTVEQIKGLEFKQIILHKIFSGPTAKAINAYLMEHPFSAESLSVHRRKDNQNLFFASFFNEIHTALTRSTFSLWFVQPETFHNNVLLSVFKTLIEPQPEKCPSHDKPQALASDKAVLDRAAQLIKRNQMALARSLLKTLHYSEEKIKLCIEIFSAHNSSQATSRSTEKAENTPQLRPVRQTASAMEIDRKKMEIDRKNSRKIHELFQVNVHQSKLKKSIKHLINNMTNIDYYEDGDPGPILYHAIKAGQNDYLPSILIKNPVLFTEEYHLFSFVLRRDISQKEKVSQLALLIQLIKENYSDEVMAAVFTYIDKNDYNFLMSAVFDDPGCVQLFLDIMPERAKARVFEQVEEGGCNLLMIALGYQPQLMGSLLLAMQDLPATSKAKILEQVDNVGWSPLMLALKSEPQYAKSLIGVIRTLPEPSKTKFFEHLSRDGANIPTLFSIVLRCDISPEEKLSQLELLIQLIKENYSDEVMAAVFTYTDKNDYNLLMGAVFDAPGCVQLLLYTMPEPAKARVFEQLEEHGCNLLMIALGSQPQLMGSLLLAMQDLPAASKAKIFGQVDNAGWSPLMLALKSELQYAKSLTGVIRTLPELSKTKIFEYTARDIENILTLFSVVLKRDISQEEKLSQFKLQIQFIKENYSDEVMAAVFTYADEKGRNLLMSVGFDDPGCVQLFLDIMPERAKAIVFEQVDERGCNLLMIALEFQPQCMESLLSAMQDLPATSKAKIFGQVDIDGWSPLMLALKSKSQYAKSLLGVIRSLPESSKTKIFENVSPDGLSILTLALEFYPEFLELLFDKMPDALKAKMLVLLDGTKRNALMLALEFKCDFVPLLLNALPESTMVSRFGQANKASWGAFQSALESYQDAIKSILKPGCETKSMASEQVNITDYKRLLQTFKSHRNLVQPLLENLLNRPVANDCQQVMSEDWNELMRELESYRTIFPLPDIKPAQSKVALNDSLNAGMLVAMHHLDSIKCLLGVMLDNIKGKVCTQVDKRGLNALMLAAVFYPDVFEPLLQGIPEHAKAAMFSHTTGDGKNAFIFLHQFHPETPIDGLIEVMPESCETTVLYQLKEHGDERLYKKVEEAIKVKKERTSSSIDVDSGKHYLGRFFSAKVSVRQSLESESSPSLNPM